MPPPPSATRGISSSPTGAPCYPQDQGCHSRSSWGQPLCLSLASHLTRPPLPLSASTALNCFAFLASSHLYEFMERLPCVALKAHLWLNLLPETLLGLLCFHPSESCSHFLSSVQLVAQSSPTLRDPMDCSRPGLPVHHQLPGFTQTHVHRVIFYVPVNQGSYLYPELTGLHHLFFSCLYLHQLVSFLEDEEYVLSAVVTAHNRYSVNVSMKITIRSRTLYWFQSCARWCQRHFWCSDIWDTYVGYHTRNQKIKDITKKLELPLWS